MSVFSQAMFVASSLAAGTVLLGTAPADAAAPPAPATRTAPHAVVLPYRPASGHSRSGQHISFSNWSGFAVTGRTYSGVSSTFVQPVVTCGADEAWSVFWVGLDGFDTGNVEQAGTSVYCPGGGAAPQYFSWWEMYPTNAITTVFAIRPGDSITAKVTYAKPNYRLSVIDNTSGKSFTRIEKCGQGITCKRSSAEWIAEAPTRLSTGDRFALAQYADVRFGSDNASSSGTKPINQWPTYYRIDMVNTDGTLDATASALAATGTSFTDVWRHE